MAARVSAGAGILVLLMGLAVTGCWNRREIETLGFIMATGFDGVAESNKVQVTVQVAKPFAMAATDGKGATQEKAFWVVSGTGHTAFEAARHLRTQSPRRLFWGHGRLVVIGEAMAREGVRDILDVLIRDNEPRERALIMVAKGARAEDVLQAEFELERMPAQGIVSVFLATRAGLATTAESMLLGFLQALEGEGVDPVAGSLEIVPRPREPQVPGELMREHMGASLEVTGAAVFSEDRLVGWLNESETRGFNWITGRARGSAIVIRNPADEGKFITVETARARGGFKAQLSQGKVSVTIKVAVEGDLADVQGFIEPLESPGEWVSMERRIATVIRNDILAAVAKAKELRADIFGFGAELNRRDPSGWARLKDRWREEFPGISVQVDVRAKLRRSGVLMRSIRTKK